MITKILLSLYCFIPLSIYSQNGIDTTRIIQSVNILILTNNFHLYDRQEIANYTCCQLDFKVLKAKGFEDFIFLKVIPLLGFIDSCKITGKNIPMIKHSDIKNYYLAYHLKTEAIYRLKGFKVNEFGEVMLMQKNGFYIRGKLSKKDLKNKYIEELNIRHMFKIHNSIYKYTKTDSW